MENRLDQYVALRRQAECVLLTQPPEYITNVSPEKLQEKFHDLRVHQVELEMQIDELRRTQAELDVSRARYFDFYNLAPVGYWTISAQGLILEANLTSAAFLGLTRSELINQSITQFVHHQDQDIYYLFSRNLLGLDVLENCDLRMVRKDGTALWVQLNAITAQDENGALVSRIVLNDITERKQAEETLRESEQDFRTLVDSGRALIWTAGTDKGCTYCNRVWLEFTGRTLEQEQGDGWLEGRHADDRQRYGERYSGAFDCREKFSMEYRLRRHDGEYRWLLEDGCPRYDSRGEFIGYIGHCLDITRRKRAEDETQRNESRLRKLVEIMQHPSDTIQDFLDYVLEQAIQLTESKIGYIYHYHEEHRELVLNSWSKEVLPACAVVNPQTCYALEKTGIWGEAVRQRRPLIVNDFQAANPLKKGCPEGHVHLSKFVTIPIFKGERIVSVVGLANKETDYDATDVLQISLLMDAVWKVTDSMQSEMENVKLQAQLLQSRKMEAVGTLAGGIAHDFNNILGAIIGYAEIAKDDIPPESYALQSVDKVLEASHRAATLVKQILAFSRQEKIERSPLQPAPIVHEALEFLRPSMPATIDVRRYVGSNTKSILADPTQVHQIVMNLCTNAFHAMEHGGGILAITLKDCELFQDDLNKFPEVRPGSFVVLAVSDTGSGIDPEISGKIFDPYFTTKKVGKGSGMGLSIAHGIVTSYGGFITSAHNPGGGTIFRIFFPAAEQEVVTAVAPVEAVSAGVSTSTPSIP